VSPENALLSSYFLILPWFFSLADDFFERKGKKPDDLPKSFAARVDILTNSQRRILSFVRGEGGLVPRIIAVQALANAICQLITPSRRSIVRKLFETNLS
jgi:hypothetical protein